MKEFNHPAMKLDQKKLLIFTALSKHLFYYRMFISKYVLEAGYVPVNPFMSFDYFLLSLDWLYVLGIIKTNDIGNILLCI